MFLKNKISSIGFLKDWKTPNGIGCCAFGFVILGLSACSSSSSDNTQAPSEQVPVEDISASLPVGGTASTISITERIATRVSNDVFEGWACLSDRGEAFVYSFFGKGSIVGFDDSQLGLEIVINAETIDSDLESQMKFSWQQQNEDSLLLDMPEQGLKVSFNNVRFTQNNEMTVYSSLRGQLYCSLQSQSET